MTLAQGVEEHQIAGAQPLGIDRARLTAQLGRVAAQAQTGGLLEHVADQTRTVKAGSRAAPAPGIAGVEQRQGKQRNVVALPLAH